MVGFHNNALIKFSIIAVLCIFSSTFAQVKFNLKNFRGVRGPALQMPYPLRPWAMAPQNKEDSFSVQDPLSLKVGTIIFPAGSIYNIKNTNIYINAQNNGNSLANEITTLPTLKNLLQNNMLEFIPQGLVDSNYPPSAQLQLDVTPEKTITFETQSTDLGQKSIVKIDKLIELLKKDLNAYDSNGYLYINGNPITITFNLSLDIGKAQVDSIVIDYITKSKWMAQDVKKPTTKTYTHDDLIKDNVLLEIFTSAS